ncbi:MAG: hypothetical protein J7K00_00090 [Candidatus Diapherotrites archaeon]|nr:hypothetical protein [Candidatus Diapherotrites archaeon]
MVFEDFSAISMFFNLLLLVLIVLLFRFFAMKINHLEERLRGVESRTRENVHTERQDLVEKAVD